MRPVPEVDVPTFEVDRFAWADGGRVEVIGRWYGVRGRRFFRPTLEVAGFRPLLAVLEHKPWAPLDGADWIAAFEWDGERGDLADATLAVAPDIAVELGKPSGTRSKSRFRRAAPATPAASASDTTAPTGPSPTAPAPSPASGRDPSPPGDDLRRERDAAVEARDFALRERDDAVEMRDAAIRARDEAIEARDAAMRRSSAAGRDVETAAADRTRRIEEDRDAARRAADDIRTDLVTAQRAADRLRAELEAAVRERDALRAERRALRAERDEARRERDDALARAEQGLTPGRPLGPQDAPPEVDWVYRGFALAALFLLLLLVISIVLAVF